MKILIVLAFSLMAGCSNLPNGQQLLEAVSFGPGESGCARISGNLDVTAGIFASTTVNVLIVKNKRAEGDENAEIPVC